MKELRNKKVNSVFGGIGIAALLCVLMVLMSWSAMVTNSDINSITSTEEDTSNEKSAEVDLTTKSEANEDLFNPADFGFDQNIELVGLRTENSKTFIGDDGAKYQVLSQEPLHYKNYLGQYVDLDTTVKVSENGYYVDEIYTPVQFSNDPNAGFVMDINGEDLVSGMALQPVLVHDSKPEHQLDGIKASIVAPELEVVGPEYFTNPTDYPKTGGSSLSYPLTSAIDLQYHVSPNMVKQDFIISMLNPNLEEFLSLSSGETDPLFGFQESMELPDGTQLWAGNTLLDSGTSLFYYDGPLSIRSIESGEEIAFISAPFADDNKAPVRETGLETDSEEPTITDRATYIISVLNGGTSIDIITAVSTQWLLDENTVYPVVIDPSVGANQVVSDNTAGYYVCDVAEIECFEYQSQLKDGEFHYDYSQTMQQSPRFEFTFPNAATGYSVAGVTAYSEIGSTSWITAGDDVAQIQILEDCGGTTPNGDTGELDNYANPSGCGAATGTYTQLPYYQTPPPAPGAPVEYFFSNGMNNFGASTTYDCDTDYSAPDYNYDIFSTMTSCYGTSYDFIYPNNGPDESGGIFIGQDYDFTTHNTNGNGAYGSIFVFQTRPAGSTQSWVDARIVSGWSGSGFSDVFQMASTDEMRLVWHCPNAGWSDQSVGWSLYDQCDGDNIYMTISKNVGAAPTPLLPEKTTTNAPGNLPPASEPAVDTFTIAPGEEAIFEFTTGSATGDADEVLIFYRTAGTTGWSDSWDLCSNTNCIAATTYTSDGALPANNQNNPAVILQNPGTYEVLVWDTFGDGTGTGSGGRVIIQTSGSSGVTYVSPSAKRLVSLVSSEVIADVDISATTSPRATVLCSSKTDCNNGVMSLFSEAYEDGGYVEFGLGWPIAPNANNQLTGSYNDARAYFNNFYLVVELEDTSPDADPPVVAFDGHYDGITSYVEGDRTLYLSLTDAKNPILYDNTDPNNLIGPVLHYNLDGSNSYSDATSTMTSATCAKNDVCTFSATIESLEAGDTVNYWWSFSDAAAYDTSKSPTQTPNPARFPASGTADLSFTIGDIYNAPTDGTDMKITTLFEDLTGPDGQGTSSVYESGYMDRQMTYYTSNGEFHFEFDFSDCGASSTSNNWIEDQCFWDADVHSAGDQSLGHWDINWDSVATSCYPGATGCTGTPANTIELDSSFGGALDVSRYGIDNLLLVYDDVANGWIVSSTGQTGIEDKLEIKAGNGVVAETYSPNIFTPPVPVTSTEVIPMTRTYQSNLPEIAGDPLGYTIATGDIGRIVYECLNYCGEQLLEISDGTNTYSMGYGFGGGFPNSYATYYSNTMDAAVHDIPNGGLLDPGTYTFEVSDPGYGDYVDNAITLETVTGTTWPTGPTSPYDTNTVSLGAYDVESYIIDLVDLSAAPTPISVGTNVGFAGVPFGTGAGQFNQICVTTAGHVLFMESSSDECAPDVAASSLGGTWSGIALGATTTGMDYQDNGLLWQIRDVKPDPDTIAPDLTGGVIGDSHALDRTITVMIADDGPFDSGVNVDPTPGVGPTVDVVITSAEGVVTTDQLALTPTEWLDDNTLNLQSVLNKCSGEECQWSATLEDLTRGDSVTYTISTRDTYPPAPNSITSTPVTFTVAEPTNSLVVEWHEFYQSTSTSYLPCSVQVVMYDVTNEFEFHYDESCEVVEDVGLIGIRESRTNYLQVLNNAPDNNIYDNPHSNNWRFTLDGNGNYMLEPFALGLNPLPLTSSNQLIVPDSSRFSMDSNCDSTNDWNSNKLFCAGNFEIPNEFSFTYYGNDYSGTVDADADGIKDNRIHVLSTGMLHFINDEDASLQKIEGDGSTTGCWRSSGAMCDLDTTSTNFPTDPLMAPFWSRENMDFCYTDGNRECKGVWWRTLPFEGAGKTMTDDVITEDHTFYLLDSPIRINPANSDYLSFEGNLTIEAGVVVEIAENKGISFDGGVNANNYCTKFTAIGGTSPADRITITSDVSLNTNALWHGLAFTNDCNGVGEADRHTLTNVDISNTLHSAITAGSRPADVNGPSCGTATQDCDVGEFKMDGMTFTNVDSAFSHGSGQGTVVTMSNFAVTDARSACFDFAQNTVATLTGTASNPSTMTNCNTNYEHDGGAIVDEPGSTAGSLTLSNVEITDSYVSLIRVDLQKVTITDVDVYVNNGAQSAVTYAADQAWSDINGGVSLGLTHGTGGEVEITNLNAGSYHHGFIHANSVIKLTNVDLGNDWAYDFQGLADTSQNQPNPGAHYFDINPLNGQVTNAQGTTGVNSVFDGFSAPSMTMFRTFPGTFNNINIDGDIKFSQFPSGTYTDAIELTDIDSQLLMIDGCEANVIIRDSDLANVESVCQVLNGASSLRIEDSTLSPGQTIDAIDVEQTNAVVVDVVVDRSSGVLGNVLYADLGSQSFLINVSNGSGGSYLPCADNSGLTANCDVELNPNGFGGSIPEVYYGGFAEVVAYRLGSDPVTTEFTQILEADVTVVANTLDSDINNLGAELFPGKTLYSSSTDSTGRTSRVAVLTGDHNGVIYDQHIIRASGAAGEGTVHPLLADGSPATGLQFIDGVNQSMPLPAFGNYNIGSIVDIRLKSPPITLDHTSMNCAWMENTDTTDPDYSAYFQNAYDPATDSFVFKGAEMVIAADMDVDGCKIELIGSVIKFQEDTSAIADHPILTISGGGSIIMTADPAIPADKPSIEGAGNVDVVDIRINSGGTLDVQSGKLKNFILDSKSGQLVVPSGATLNLADNAYVTSSDLTGFTSTHPLVHIDGGEVTVSGSATLAGSGSGVGVKISNSGDIAGDGLIISNMDIGLDTLGGSLSMDNFKSINNLVGVQAQDGPVLPQSFRSATLQGITPQLPLQAAYSGTFPTGMDNCFDTGQYGANYWTAAYSPSDWMCWEWQQHTVDLSSWIGAADYLQPAMKLNYDGTDYNGLTRFGFFSSSYNAAVALDNLQIVVTDTSGASYVIDDSSDIGYYPWGNSDPAVGQGATYLGGLGGAPFWDCNYGGTSGSPYLYGEGMFEGTSTSAFYPGIGSTLGYSQPGYGYHPAFPFKITTGDNAPGYQTSRPLFSWGYDDPIDGRRGPGLSAITNPGTYHDTPIGDTRVSPARYEACHLRANFETFNSANVILEWPTIDLTSATIANVELQYDMLHEYEGAYLENRFGYGVNDNRDGVELLARSGNSPANMGDFSNEIVGKGISLTNSEIIGAEIGLDFKGNLVASMTNVEIDNPSVYGIRTSGINDLTMDGIKVTDTPSAGSANIGFFTESSSTGSQDITNSVFEGLGTAVYLTNDEDTSVSNSFFNNSLYGIRISTQSSADHSFSNVEMNGNDIGISAEGIGTIDMSDVSLNSVTTDVQINGGNVISFLDGVVDQAKVTIDANSVGTFDRDRSYIAKITAGGAPISGASVSFSSREVGESSNGLTDANGVTSGLRFSIYDLDATSSVDYTAMLDSYSLSTVAEVDYNWVSTTDNIADFRYIQAVYPEIDPQNVATDTLNSINYGELPLVDLITTRVCSNNNAETVIAPCAGTFGDGGNREYLNGMMEYGSVEGLDDGNPTLDLSGEAIMIDAGDFILKDGVELIMDNAVVFSTGVNDFVIEHGAWISEVPYGAKISMDGGEINGAYPSLATGEPVGLLLGGYWGETENALNLDINNVVFNNIAGIATGLGDRTLSGGSYSTYIPTVELTDNYFNHYRGYFFTPASVGAVDMCLRFSGVDGGVVSGNTFSGCTIGIGFMPSQVTTTSAHELIGSDNMYIADNSFDGASASNIWTYFNADVDLMTLHNNTMSCAICRHVWIYDDSSGKPTITDNTFNGGLIGIDTTSTEFVTIDNNTFNNQENYAINANGGDFDVTRNTINNPGEYAIYADALEKPSEVFETIVAGVNSPQPDDGVSFLSWTSSCGGYGYGVGTGGPQCTSGDVTAVLNQGEEMIFRLIAGNYPGELSINYKDPSGNFGKWTPSTSSSYDDGELSYDSGTPLTVLTAPGTYTFNLEDSWGDGPNDGGFEVIKSGAGTWAAVVNPNPAYYWDPGVNGLLTTEPTSYSNGYGWNTASSGSGCSKDMDGIIIQNTGTDPVSYDLTGIDTWGDGWGSSGDWDYNGWVGAYEAPVGTWTPGYGPKSWSACLTPTLGTYMGGIGSGQTISFTDGTYSDPLSVTLDAGQEMHFRFWCSGSYCGEVALMIQEGAPVDNSWEGPTIADNTINFDGGIDNNPLGVGLYLSNCDVQSYSILTESNNINIGQNAVWNDGCIWNDKNSVITGSNQLGSIGYNDDNQFSADVTLEGTNISGFETGIYKTGGGILELTGDANITAGDNGVGVHTDGIDVIVTSALLNGGSTGTGILIENSSYAWVYPMDVSGNIGAHVKNSEILWDGGSTDASTALRTENVSGTVQSIIDTASSGYQIDAQVDSRLTVIDFPLDESRVVVDSTSIVDESNWLSIDADHLGAAPTSDVGVSIMSSEGSSEYTSPVFRNAMTVDGNSDDWFGGNVKNPSGYAMPGLISGPMYVTVDGQDLVFGFDGIDSATSDVYIYIDSNDFAGSMDGISAPAPGGYHTLPFAADYVIKADSTGASVYYYNNPTWTVNAVANAISAEDPLNTFLEISVPISSIGGTSVDEMNLIAMVQDTGSIVTTSVIPDQVDANSGQSGNNNGGTYTESYTLTLNKLDLTNGVMDKEVLLYRTFDVFGVSEGHTYQVMVKTAAETRHTCDFDWATEQTVNMSTTRSLTLDIKQACPEINSLLDDVQVLEDSSNFDFDLQSLVDDVQDQGAGLDLKWTITEGNMVAFDNILTDFTDAANDEEYGTLSITPINDQFGTFELTFVVEDSHGQTDDKKILFTVNNVNDAPVICDIDVDSDCINGDVYLYYDPGNVDNDGNVINPPRWNSLDESFTSYSEPLGKTANSTVGYIRDMANEQFPVDQDYTWSASSDCDQLSVDLQRNTEGIQVLEIIENQAWEQGGICDIVLDLQDDGNENQAAQTVTVPFTVAPVNDEPVIATAGLVESLDATNSFTGELDGNYRVTLVEDTTDPQSLTFNLSGIKSDIDHLPSDLQWSLEDAGSQCTSSNYYTYSFTDVNGQVAPNGDYLTFVLHPDATTNAEPWEIDKLNRDGERQTRTPNGFCEMTLSLSDTAAPPVNMPNGGNGLNYTALAESDYDQETVSVTLLVKVDNVAENVPDYYLDGDEGFDFNGVNKIMPGTMVPVDFSIYAGGDDGDYTYNHLLEVTLQTDGHTELQLPRLYTPPAFGTSLDIDDWEVLITDQTTEVWVEVDVVTCNVGQVCTPVDFVVPLGTIQEDNPESHNRISGTSVFGKWSEPGRIGETSTQESSRRPAFEDKNWCNNLMTSNAAGTSVHWDDAASCGHTDKGYSGAFAEEWQTGGNALPVRVTTIGALSVASFAPSIIAVALTGMFVSALVLAGRRDDDEEEFMEETTISDDESAVSPVIATILMVAITVVLSGVVYVWAAQLAQTDTKGVPVVTFSAENVDTGSIETDHWMITIGQAQTVLATQAVDVVVDYINATGGQESQRINLASTDQVYGFSPYNSDSLVTFSDVVTIDGDETISTFSTGDDIYVKTHLSDGTPLVDATIRIVYNPPGDTQSPTLKTYRGMSWNQPV